MQDCLAAFTEAEDISDFTCEGCGQRRATKRLGLLACPPVLVLTLKRFAKEASGWHCKNTARIAIPETGLDVRPFCSANGIHSACPRLPRQLTSGWLRRPKRRQRQRRGESLQS